MSTHTKEPWIVEGGGERSATRILSDGRLVGEWRDAGWDGPCPNSERMVACVNACAGINPEAVAGLLRALERISRAAANVNASTHAELDTEIVDENLGELYHANNEANAAIAKATIRRKP